MGMEEFMVVSVLAHEIGKEDGYRSCVQNLIW